MRFKNNTRFILPLGPGLSLGPYAVTSELSPKQVEENSEIQMRLLNKQISEFTGAVTPPAPVKVDVRYEVDPTVVDGKLVKVPATPGKKPVQYVVADAEGSDGVSMDTEGTVTSLGKEIHKSPDYIEEGVNAQAFKNGAEALENELNREFEESTFDDNDTLSENESERDDAEDADAAIQADAQEFLQKQGRNGAEVTTAKAMIEKDVTREMAKVTQAVAKSLDNGETVEGASGKVTDFLKQPINAKKFMIAKETDATFLKEVDTISQSETVKQLVQQRLEELK